MKTKNYKVVLSILGGYFIIPEDAAELPDDKIVFTGSWQQCREYIDTGSGTFFVDADKVEVL